MSMSDKHYTAVLDLARDHNMSRLSRYLTANPNAAVACNENGHPILSRLCNEGALDAIRLLIEHGADPNQRNQYGETALFGFFADLSTAI